MKRKFNSTKSHKRDDEIVSDESDFDEEETLFNHREISAAALSKNEKMLQKKERKVPRIDKVSEFAGDASMSIDEKRVAISKQYLEKIKEFENEQNNNAEFDALMKSKSRDPIAERLMREAMQSQKRIPNNLARRFAASDESRCTKVFYKGHKKPPTCLSVAPGYKQALSGGKDCCLIHWDLETGKKLSIIRGHRSKTLSNKGHTDEILACAISPNDSNLAASAGRDKVIKLWDLRTQNSIGELTGHFGAITGLCFQLGTTTLFSSSLDRTVKVWDFAEQSFVETLYGHEAEVMAVDSLHSYRVVSCSSDHTVRLWKVEEESQLLFKSHNQNIDCVKMLRENVYLSAGQNGNIHVFNRSKRKPLYTYTNTGSNIDKQFGKNLGWISSLAPVQYSDMFVAGSDYGHVDFYGMDSGFIRRVAIPSKNQSSEEFKGWINGMCIDFEKSSQTLTLVGVSAAEHRLGRWGAQKGVRNGIWVMKWNMSQDDSDSESDDATDGVQENEEDE